MLNISAENKVQAMELNLLIRRVPEFQHGDMGTKIGISFLLLWGVTESKLLLYWKDMVHGQCLRTVDWPTPTATSYTSPNVCCPHHPIQ